MSSSETLSDFEASVISINLNSAILFIFLTGMYTVIYCGTIYIYFTKNRSKSYPVPVAITMLYLSSVSLTALEWYITKWEFVDNGDTRQSVILAVLAYPPWVYVAGDIMNFLIVVIADALLIWRCFYVWNRSLCIISVPLCFIVAEIVLFSIFILFHARYNNLNVSTALAARINDVAAAAYFISFTTTLVTTILIASRIYSVTNQQGTSSRRFKHIVDIVVQSGAIYALSQLLEAISNVLLAANASNLHAIAFDSYMQTLNTAIAGISATVMVTRVALLSDDTTYPSTSVHISGLQFHVRSTHASSNIEAIDITHPVDDDSLLAREGQIIKDKTQSNW